MQQQEGSEVLIIATAIIVLVLVFLIVLFTVFQRRKNNLLEEKEDAKKYFEREIAETQIEIREGTLRSISWELHDNIGQLLTLAKIQLQQASGEHIPEITETVTKSLEEIRVLSKLINPEYIKNIKLKEALALEVDRFNRLNYIKATLKVEGKIREIDDKAGIIMFRMLQEFFSNTIKHAKATHLDVSLSYKKKEVEIIAKDDGVGFIMDDVSAKGIGLHNIKNRAKLIGAKINLKTVPNKGTTLIINYYF